MADVYVYCFTGWDGLKGVGTRSRATLETINRIGDPIMESQIVVDEAELDSNGFFLGDVANDADPLEGIKSQINSLNLRAASRDREAKSLNEADSGARKYLLQLESRELRKQAKRLQRQCDCDKDAVPQFGTSTVRPLRGQA